MKKVVFGVSVILLAGIFPALLSAQSRSLVAAAPPPPPPPPTPRIALLDSRNYTREFFRRRYAMDGVDCSVGTFLGADEYERYFLGWKYVLDGQMDNATFNSIIPPEDLGGGVFYPQLDSMAASYASQYEIIYDKDPDEITEESLSRFTVLILSNTASLTDEQSRIIQQWVLKGGKLIATYGAGYKDIIENPHDPEGADPLKSQKGSTSGLHELWKDPWTKAFGTQSVTKPDGTHYGIDVIITKNEGPTDLFEWSARPILSYGAEANLLVPRPEHFQTALGFLTFDREMDALKRLYPAILLVKANKGEVLYFAYAPEFIVSLAFDLAGHCANDNNYDPGDPAPGLNLTAGMEDLPNGFSVYSRVRPQLQMMEQAIKHMLGIL
jgi:hypothetical protein